MKRIKGTTAFVLTAVLLLGFAPFISTYAADEATINGILHQKIYPM